MIKKLLVTGLFLSTIIAPTYAENLKYKAVDEFTQEKFLVDTNLFFKEKALFNREVSFDDKKLLTTVSNTLDYFKNHLKEDPVVQRDGILGIFGVTVPEVIKTLEFMKQILEEDISKNQKSRLSDTKFINENFKIINWKPFNPKDKDQKNIRITKYVVFTHEGSKTKTAKFNIPLYEIRDKKDEFYKKYTKQEVLSGVFEKKGKEFGKVNTLVYLTREGLEEALMEGTLKVVFKDASTAFYNVDKNNGIAYVKGLKRENQKRYWYFKNVNAINGYGKDIENRIKVELDVTFAGDVFNIGLGKIVLLEYEVNKEKKSKLGIIADTGGAFLPNLHQLDFLAGVFKTRQDFVNYSKSLPPYANVYFLIKK